MNFLKKIIVLLIFLFPISNSFGAMITHNQTVSYETGDLIAGVAFNADGTKVFTTYASSTNLNEYNLSTPYDISTKTYAGDSERCTLSDTANTIYDLEFSSDGMYLFVVTRNAGSDTANSDIAYRYDLTSPYDVSTCTFAHETTDLDSTTYTSGSQAGDFDHTKQNRKHRLQGIEINNDGTKLFLVWSDHNNAAVGARLLEYTLSTPYDLRTLSLVTTAGVSLGVSGNNNVHKSSWNEI